MIWVIVAVFGIGTLAGPLPLSAITGAFSGLVGPKEVHVDPQEKARLNEYAGTVNGLIAAYPDRNVAVATVDVATGSPLTLGSAGTFTGASTAKLITAVTLLDQVEKEKIDLDQTIKGEPARTLLENMIVWSDNGAWQVLNKYLTHDVLDAYTAQTGWHEYDPKVNSVLPAEMVILVAKLYKGELLDAGHTKLLLSFMQRANKREYIVSAVPDGYTVYHKAGWLEGLMHDIAIITDGRRTIVLAIYTFQQTGEGDSASNRQLFGDITAAALKAYFPAQ